MYITMVSNSTVLGIDLGTMFSCVAVYKDGKVKVIDNDSGSRVMRSCVYYGNSETLVGDAGENMMCLKPERTVYDAKRMIGRKFNESCVQEDMKLWPFKVRDNGGRPVYEVGEKKKIIYPEAVSALVLKKLKEVAKKRLGFEVRDAIITVPAYFNSAHRQATLDSGVLAGLNIIKLINEPTAAALAFGIDNTNSDKKINTLVYDLGGGTFDVTVMTMEDGILDVKSTSGNSHLGGQDFTNKILKYCIDDIKNKTNKDVSKDKTAMALLRKSCEDAKKLLSSSEKATIILQNGYYNYKTFLLRKTFEELNNALFDSTLHLVRDALSEADMQVSDIDEILLVGGSTRIPKIKKILKSFFNNKNINETVNPDEVVACGAAILGSMVSESCGNKTDIKPEFSNKTLYKLRDVNSISLGTGVTEKNDTNTKMSVTIKKNSRVPTESTKRYYTVKTNQSYVNIDIYAGENSYTKDNILLDTFTIHDLPPGSAGSVEIEVTFKIDENGILKVTAVETSKGQTKSVVVTNVNDIMSEEMKRLRI